MNLVQLLEERREAILKRAMETVGRSHLPHYEGAGAQVTRERLGSLYDRVLESARHRSVDPVKQYAARLAEERFAAGVDLLEVQTAINVLEESVWQAVVAGFSGEDLPEGLGAACTIFGAGKDALARAYVVLASRSHAPALDTTALFRGTEQEPNT